MTSEFYCRICVPIWHLIGSWKLPVPTPRCTEVNQHVDLFFLYSWNPSIKAKLVRDHKSPFVSAGHQTIVARNIKLTQQLVIQLFIYLCIFKSRFPATYSVNKLSLFQRKNSLLGVFDKYFQTKIKKRRTLLNSC